MRRREFAAGLLGAAAWPISSHAQQPGLPLVGFLSGRSVSSDSHLVLAFREGLNEAGFIEGQNVAIEFRWANGQFDQLTTLAADLVARQAAVIFAGGVDVRIREIHAAISR